MAINICPWASCSASHPGVAVFDTVAGKVAVKGSQTGSSYLGNYTFTVTGAAWILVTPVGTITGTTRNTGAQVGFELSTQNGGTTMLSAFSVRSN
jgi:hypothetical protein